MAKNHSKDGFVHLAVIAIICVCFFLLHTSMLSLGSLAVSSRLAQPEHEGLEARSIVRHVFAEHCLHDIQLGRIGKSPFERLKNRLKWALEPLYHLQDTYLNELSPEATQGERRRHFGSPFMALNGSTLSRDLIVTYSNEQGRNQSLKCTATYKLVPATEAQFVSPAVFLPGNNSIAIETNGLCLLNGIHNEQGSTKITCSELITPFFIGNQELSCKSRYVSPVYSFTLHANAENIFSHNTAVNPQKVYVNAKLGALTVHFDGNNLNQPVDGLEVTEHLGMNKVAVNIDRVSAINLVIICDTLQAVKSGILVRGTDKKDCVMQTLTTNGRVWLCGDHCGSPVVVASSNGYWNFSGKDWAPAMHRTLRLKWNGYIAATAIHNVFSSPESPNKDGVLEVNGTFLLNGSLTGNLATIVINKNPEMDRLANHVEKICTLMEVR